MAKIEELVRQISDVKLRDEIATEIKELKKQKRFGLVFEEHLPEIGFLEAINGERYIHGLVIEETCNRIGRNIGKLSAEVH